ncbi:tryptase-like [Brevipalpus obovatus]|uniref:tryptase-like n=1 Tax=Brevipalpus obovatus TaxID=246614 RepID=UPI003D9DC020
MTNLMKILFPLSHSSRPPSIIITLHFHYFKGGIIESPQNDFTYIVSIRDINKPNHHRGAGTIFFQGNWILTSRAIVAKSDYDGEKYQYVIREAYDLIVYPKWGIKLSGLKSKNFCKSQKTFCYNFTDEPEERLTFTNIALVKLSGSIPVDKNFSSLELIPEDHDFRHNDKILVGGWGIYDSLPRNPLLSDNLMQGEIPSKLNCSSNEYYKPLAHMCAHREDVGVCRGEYGGPAVVRTPKKNRDRIYLAGVINFNDNDKACSMGRSYFLNVTYFRDFIDHVRRHEPAEYECKNMVNKFRSKPPPNQTV